MSLLNVITHDATTQHTVVRREGAVRTGVGPMLRTMVLTVTRHGTHRHTAHEMRNRRRHALSVIRKCYSKYLKWLP